MIFAFDHSMNLLPALSPDLLAAELRAEPPLQPPRPHSDDHGHNEHESGNSDEDNEAQGQRQGNDNDANNDYEDIGKGIAGRELSVSKMLSHSSVSHLVLARVKALKPGDPCFSAIV